MKNFFLHFMILLLLGNAPLMALAPQSAFEPQFELPTSKKFWDLYVKQESTQKLYPGAWLQFGTVKDFDTSAFKGRMEGDHNFIWAMYPRIYPGTSGSGFDSYFMYGVKEVSQKTVLSTHSGKLLLEYSQEDVNKLCHDLNLFRQSEKFRQQLRHNHDIYLTHLGLKYDEHKKELSIQDKSRFNTYVNCATNHNQSRISRVLMSLAMFGERDCADSLMMFLIKQAPLAAGSQSLWQMEYKRGCVLDEYIKEEGGQNNLGFKDFRSAMSLLSSSFTAPVDDSADHKTTPGSDLALAPTPPSGKPSSNKWRWIPWKRPSVTNNSAPAKDGSTVSDEVAGKGTVAKPTTAAAEAPSQYFELLVQKEILGSHHTLLEYRPSDYVARLTLKPDQKLRQNKEMLFKEIYQTHTPKAKKQADKDMNMLTYTLKSEANIASKPFEMSDGNRPLGTINFYNPTLVSDKKRLWVVAGSNYMGGGFEGSGNVQEELLLMMHPALLHAVSNLKKSQTNCTVSMDRSGPVRFIQNAMNIALLNGKEIYGKKLGDASEEVIKKSIQPGSLTYEDYAFLAMGKRQNRQTSYRLYGEENLWKDFYQFYLMFKAAKAEKYSEVCTTMVGAGVANHTVEMSVTLQLLAAAYAGYDWSQIVFHSCSQEDINRIIRDRIKPLMGKPLKEIMGSFLQESPSDVADRMLNIAERNDETKLVYGSNLPLSNQVMGEDQFTKKSA